MNQHPATPAAASPCSTPWVMQAPVISTAHLSLPTMEQPIVDGELFGLIAAPIEGGLIVHVNEDVVSAAERGELIEPELPPDLLNAICWAKANGYDWISFDEDGDAVPNLKIYPWV